MTQPDNRTIVTTVFNALAEGQSKPLVDAMADDFSWTLTGASSWSRTFAGKAAVLGTLFKVLRERLDGRIKTQPRRIIAEGDLVVVEAQGDNVTLAGIPYRNSYCFVLRLAGGKLISLTEYCDTELAVRTLGEYPG